MKINCDQEGINKASQIINDDGIIIFPTDTVYGIGCNPFNKDSVSKIFDIKNREGVEKYTDQYIDENELWSSAE